jgi:hypothetical protein
MHENEARHQQETIGILGVNLIYGAFFHWEKPLELLESLYDNISRDAIEIDSINFNGPDFENVDNRLMSLYLIKKGFTDAVIFGPEGNNILPADLLYKKNILVLRGSFRPATKVNIDMIKKGYGYFVKEKKVNRDNLVVLFEITLNNLLASGEIDEQDFLDRAEVLCSLGQTVLISNYQQYYKLVEYLGRYTKERMGLIMGVGNLKEIFDEKYYRELNGGILEAFGILFSRDLKVYVYPTKTEGTDNEVETTEWIKIHPRLKPLYDYLLFNRRIRDIENYDPDILHIFSSDVLRQIKNVETVWEDKIPAYVDHIIKEHRLFGYQIQKENTKL